MAGESTGSRHGPARAHRRWSAPRLHLPRHPRGGDEVEEGSHLPGQQRRFRRAFPRRAESRPLAIGPQERPQVFLGGDRRHPGGELEQPLPLVRFRRAGSQKTRSAVERKAVVGALGTGSPHAQSRRGDGRPWPPGGLSRPRSQQMVGPLPVGSRSHRRSGRRPWIGHDHLQPAGNHAGVQMPTLALRITRHPRSGRMGGEPETRHHRRPLLESPRLGPWQHQRRGQTADYSSRSSRIRSGEQPPSDHARGQ